MKTYHIKRPRHHISEKQDRWYWREWAKARKALLAAGFASHEADERRHAIHAEELGADKSHRSFNDAEFECVIAGFLAVSEPDNLDAQVRLRSGSQRRLMEGIRRLARGREEYIQSIIEDVGETRDWTRLAPAEMVKLRATLARRVEREPRRVKPNQHQHACETQEISRNSRRRS